jgi:hypothetical protein
VKGDVFFLPSENNQTGQGLEINFRGLVSIFILIVTAKVTCLNVTFALKQAFLDANASNVMILY